MESVSIFSFSPNLEIKVYAEREVKGKVPYSINGGITKATKVKHEKDGEPYVIIKQRKLYY